MAAATADQDDVSSRQCLEPLRRLRFDDGEVPQAEVRAVRLNERDCLLLALNGVDMARRREARRLDRQRARPRADVVDDIISFNLSLDERQDADLLLRHRHLAADECLIAESQLHCHPPPSPSSIFASTAIRIQLPVSGSAGASASVVSSMRSSS